MWASTLLLPHLQWLCSGPPPRSYAHPDCSAPPRLFGWAPQHAWPSEGRARLPFSVAAAPVPTGPWQRAGPGAGQDRAPVGPRPLSPGPRPGRDRAPVGPRPPSPGPSPEDCHPLFPGRRVWVWARPRRFPPARRAAPGPGRPSAAWERAGGAEAGAGPWRREGRWPGQAPGGSGGRRRRGAAERRGGGARAGGPSSGAGSRGGAGQVPGGVRKGGGAGPGAERGWRGGG